MREYESDSPQGSELQETCSTPPPWQLCLSPAPALQCLLLCLVPPPHLTEQGELKLQELQPDQLRSTGSGGQQTSGSRPAQQIMYFISTKLSGGEGGGSYLKIYRLIS